MPFPARAFGGAAGTGTDTDTDTGTGTDTDTDTDTGTGTDGTKTPARTDPSSSARAGEIRSSYSPRSRARHE